MKRIIITILAISTGLCVAREFTIGTRFDTTSEPGVTYVGESVTDHPTVVISETNATWMITKITTNGVYHSNGSKFTYDQVWTNRLNITYK